MSRFFATASIAALLAGGGLGASAVAQQAAPQTLEALIDAGERVVVTGMVPVPDVGEGAPLFTSGDLANLVDETKDIRTRTQRDFRKCGGTTGIQPSFRKGVPSMGVLLSLEYEAGSRVIRLAERARKVTELAEAARRDAAAAGSFDMALVETRELERQAAVKELQEARGDLFEARAMIGDFQSMRLSQRDDISWTELDRRAMNRERDGVGLGVGRPVAPDALGLQNLRAAQSKDRKGKDIIVVTGEIINNGKESQRIPDLAVTLVDDRGWALANSVVSPPWHMRGIGGGKTRAFQTEIAPAPDLQARAVVSFAPKHAADPRLGVSYFCGPALRLNQG